MSSTKSCRWPTILIVLLVHFVRSQDLNHRRDPTPIIYPGQVNIGLISNIHENPGPNGTGPCGPLRQDAVQRVMASVWAAHQVNFRKDDPKELNIGVYIFDTCGRQDVAERQVYRLLGHVGHVQTTACTDKRIPPLFAVITEGDRESLKIPSKLLDAFGVPVISTTGSPLLDADSNPENYLSTSPTTETLARAAVTVLRQLRLLEVAVIAEDNPRSALFSDFSKEAQVSGMQALPVEHPNIAKDTDNFFASLQVISQYGKTRLKAIVFLVNTEQALDLLKSVDSSSHPQIPWVIVTQEDLSPIILKKFKRHQLKRLQQVLLLSPETTKMPEFQEYFKQLLQEDTIKYHPLLVEFANSASNPHEWKTTSSPWRRSSRQMTPFLPRNDTATTFPDMNTFTTGSTSTSEMTTSKIPPSAKFRYEEADVSAVVKAVWTLAASLKAVQTKSCRRGTDCLLYLRRSLSSYVMKAARTLDYTLDSDSGSSELRGNRLYFNDKGVLVSVRYSLKGFTYRGDIQEVGWYSNDKGLAVDHDIISPFNGFVFKEDPPASSSPEVVQTENVPKSKFTSEPETMSNTDVGFDDTTAEVIIVSSPDHDPEETLSLERDEDHTRWKVLDDSKPVPDVLSQTEPSDIGKFQTDSSITLTSTRKPPAYAVSDIGRNYNQVFPELTDDVQSINILNNDTDKDYSYDLVIGPAYKSEQQSSSNLRSISLTSHQEPGINNAFRAPKANVQVVHHATDLNLEGPALARAIDRSSASVAKPIGAEDVKVVSSNRNLHISAWLSRPWALTVLGLCGFGILATLYVLVFLMVKSCEGSLKKTNIMVALGQLLSLLCLYVSAALFTWKPSPLLCGLQRLMPNISYAFCFGCLLLKGMHLMAQNNLGLGGSVNKCNQVLTLIFIVGVQVALEIQWWFIKPPQIIHDTYECALSKEEILESQGYISFLLALCTTIAVFTRKIPYSLNEGRSLIATALTCLIVFLSWDISCWLLPDSNSRNIAAPSALILTALVVLLGIFGPQLFAIHRYGGFPHKPLSYADSLSTVFTMFKDLDNASNVGTTGRGKKTAKTLETPFGTELGEGTRNPLYSDYQSAYP